MDIGKTIRLLRNERGLNQKVFAYKLGITPTYLSLLETNKKNASPSLIKLICKKLRISTGGFCILSLTVDDVPKNTRGIFECFQPTLNRIFLNN